MYKLLGALFLLGLIACSKYEPGTYDTPRYQVYSNSHLTNFGTFRLVAASGEITAPGLAQQYAHEFHGYFYNETTTYNDPVFRTFSLLEADSIVNISMAPAIEAKRKAIDTYDTYTSKWWIILPDTNAISLHIGKYKPFIKTVTTPTGGTYFDSQAPEYYLKKRGDTLFFPMIRYLLISRTDHSVSFSAERVNNVFSPAVAAKLGPKDTLIIQTFELAMKRVQ